MQTNGVALGCQDSSAAGLSIMTTRLGPCCATSKRSIDDSHHIRPIWKRPQQEQSSFSLQMDGGREAADQ
jgi:hypothetical protein